MAKSIHGIFWHLEHCKFGILFMVSKKVLEQRQSMLLQLAFWLTWTGSWLLVVFGWIVFEDMKDLLQVWFWDTFAVQYLLCWLEFSVPTLSISLLNVLSVYSGSCRWFRVFLWKLPKVIYQEAVATSLVECCSFFSINFGYISNPLQDANISSICLCGV